MPLPSTMTPIATITFNSAANSVTFSNIPQNYTDLVLIATTPGGASNQNIGLNLNSDTGANYSVTTLVATSSGGVSSDRETNTSNPSCIYLGADSNAITYFQNYTNSSTYKTVLTESKTPGFLVLTRTLLWRNTSAITSIKFQGGTNFPTGSTFTLYGIKAA